MPSSSGGDLPRLVVYDNLKPAVLQVLQGHSRREHELFITEVLRFAA
jgi:hypothetical protein